MAAESPHPSHLFYLAEQGRRPTDAEVTGAHCALDGVSTMPDERSPKATELPELMAEVGGIGPSSRVYRTRVIKNEIPEAFEDIAVMAGDYTTRAIRGGLQVGFRLGRWAFGRPTAETTVIEADDIPQYPAQKQ